MKNNGGREGERSKERKMDERSKERKKNTHTKRRITAITAGVVVAAKKNNNSGINCTCFWIWNEFFPTFCHPPDRWR
jgi:hypothetical protein